MIISKKLMGVLVVSGAVAAALPSILLGSERANDVPSPAASTTRKEAAPAGPAPADRDALSPAEARHFAAYTRFRAMEGASGSSENTEGQAKREPGTGAYGPLVCPDPRQVN